MNKLCLALGLLGLACSAATLGQESRPTSAPSSQPAAKIYSAWPFDAKEAVRRQDETAKALSVKKELVLDIDEKQTMKLVLIPAGKFKMGSPDNEKERVAYEGPQHPVTLTHAYFMGLTEVTQAQYEAVMGKNPSAFKAPNNPVDSVSWNDATGFCKKLSEKTKKTVRLPTEAEWEHACRAGTATAYSFSGNLAEYGWCHDNAGNKTHPVSLKKPNPFGLFDMHGNVWEWCSDWYEDHYDLKASAVDPQGPASAKKHSMRGGAWAARPQRCSTAMRGGGDPGNRSNYIGFRVVVLAAVAD